MATNAAYIDIQESHMKELSNSDLTKLNAIGVDMSKNEFTKFPPVLKNLTALTHINADGNQISSLENLTLFTNLSKVDVCKNCVTEVPSCLTSLTKLFQFSLFANRIRTFPNGFCYLKELNLGSNEISEIPLHWDLPSLTSVDLSQNNLCRVEGITSLSNLVVMNLGTNKITSLPSIGCLLKLENIDVSNNRIGSLPISITQLTYLSSFNGDYNPIKSLPEGFLKLKSLRLISLCHSQFEGFTEPLGALSRLQTLMVSNLNLTTLPKEINAVKEMRTLDVSNNKIVEITALPKTTDDFIATNNLINTFSPEGTIQIGFISLRNNDLDHFPLKLNEIMNLQNCDLSKNKITTIPDIPLELNYLRAIDVSFNLLTSIPPIFQRCPKLTKLNASYNHLTTFPPLSSLQNLKVLLLAGNLISEIPQELSTLTNLSLLHLANNRFTDCPKILSELPNIQRLSLCMNSLTTLPDFVNKSLVSFDVSNNRLTSVRLPDAPNLRRLKLSHNALVEIPMNQTKLPKLEILDLSSNGLLDFKVHPLEFPSLQVLDLSLNNLSSVPNIGKRKFVIRMDGNPSWQAVQFPFLSKFNRPEEFMTEAASFSFCSKCSNREEMQDSIICIPNFTAPDHFLFAAVDGHLGNVVSNTFSQKFPALLYGFLKTTDVRTAFFQAFEEIQKQLTEMKVTDGAVVTVSFVTPTHIHVAQCGDCRAVYITDNEVYQMCDEHTPANPQEFKRIKEYGGYTERGRVFGDYIVSRSIGDIALKPVISDLPEFVSIKRVKNERYFIVASDGLWDQLSNTDIVALLKKKKDCVRIAELSSMLCDVAFVMGSTDNICVVVCKLI
ncbi:leucine-rich repeat containing protein, putative [Entamoeba invadens IP1]|uniref:Leucine-rich repeat containing protein, putative n=1 Tax=Entamoeba invadens IP1 TaxID=370355 RepID=A0A0A1TWY1_ENTIV|nr:leucine-rich repeat containing protein, putative [Entamoeba invadens IP1]ELP83833.1 leucine-rich repeat containing protein, putative [Entamoeba invadens IP1]|eukprot:XP_004183179.1 leucine-rich repeat containing protein, putative [Entamoeba invadens IP1]